LNLLFKLLDKFAAEKDQFAAVVYKTLTFALVENYDNVTLREFILLNFIQVFNHCQTIPVGILLEPILRQIQVSQERYLLNIYDIEFFNNVLRHPKFNPTLAEQMFQVMSEIYLTNILFADATRQIITEILSNFLNDNESLQDSVIKFSKAALATFYTSLSNKKKERSPPRNTKSMPSLTPAPGPSESDKELINTQKRGQVIEILRIILNMNNSNVNENLKVFLLYTHKQIKETLRKEHKGIAILLNFFGEPSTLFDSFENEQKTENQVDDSFNDRGEPVSQSLEFRAGENSKITDNYVHKSVESEAMSFVRQYGNKQKAKPKAFKLTKAQVSELALMKHHKPEPKAIEDIENIRLEHQYKRLKKLEEQEQEKEKLDKKRKKLNDQLEKRKIELGVSTKNKKDEEANIIFPEGSIELMKAMEKKTGLPEIEVIHLDNEEQRDKDVVLILLRRYHKVIKHLFNSYSNTGFSMEGKDTFENYSKKSSTINIPELVKMLNDHDCQKLIDKEELKALVRLVNTDLCKRLEVTNLTASGFEQFLIQLAIFIFGRPPQNLSHLPIFVSVEKLFAHFRDATAKKGKSTTLYDDPDKTDMGDKELNMHLNAQLREDPNFPLPDVNESHFY